VLNGELGKIIVDVHAGHGVVLLLVIVSIRFPVSPQLFRRGLCCPERRPLFRGVAREKA
jgi:hypothetical protein